MDIAGIRKEYKLRSLDEKEVASDPVFQFERWWNEAIKSEIAEVNAMTLCTVSADGKPHGRTVLLKGFDKNGFVFFTNYRSHKGAELAANPYAELVFFWKELERQVRIHGSISQIGEAESDAYFKSRPLGSQLGALASPQSQEIESRQVLEDNLEELKLQYPDGNISRPTHWGGYNVMPESIEFWQGRSNRLHDRILYTLENEEWKIRRLAP